MHRTASPLGSSRAADRHALLVLICTSAPSFMIQLDANIVSVSLPAIARSLGVSFAGIEWVITAYILSFASLLLPAGATCLSGKVSRSSPNTLGNDEQRRQRDRCNKSRRSNCR